MPTTTTEPTLSADDLRTLRAIVKDWGSLWAYFESPGTGDNYRDAPHAHLLAQRTDHRATLELPCAFSVKNYTKAKAVTRIAMAADRIQGCDNRAPLGTFIRHLRAGDVITLDFYIQMSDLGQWTNTLVALVKRPNSHGGVTVSAFVLGTETGTGTHWGVTTS